MLAIDTQGTHPSTQLCLMALQWLQEYGEFAHLPPNVLDIGCGNGILSVASASIWNANVIAADISEKALEDAKIHVSEHGLESQITLLRSDGFAHPRIKAHSPYDIILFNMLAEWHIRMALDIQKNLARGGYGILCGTLVWLQDDVKQSYKSLGFEIIKEFTATPWTGTLIRHK